MLSVVPTLLAGTPTFDSLVTMIENGKAEELQAAFKANPDSVHIRNENNFPLIHRASMTDKHQAVAVLLEAGAKVDSHDTNFGRTPLHIAAAWSTLDMVQLLWSHGADPHSTTTRGRSVLDFAGGNFYQDKDTERDKILAFLRGRGSKMSEGAKKRQAVVREVERDSSSRPDRGEDPKENDWAVDIVKEYIKSKTEDPSVKFHEWSQLTAIGDKWAVRVKFQYEKYLGVTRQDDRWFYIRGGKVIETKAAH